MDEQAEYIIVSCCPDIPLSKCDDNIGLLNRIIEDINSINPDMTAEYLGILLIASGLDITDETFIRRVSTNSFIFKDISDIQCEMAPQEIAARYMVSELEIPFDGLDKETLAAISNEKVSSYIKWDEVWATYSVMGFSLVEDSNFGNGLYLVYWRR